MSLIRRRFSPPGKPEPRPSARAVSKALLSLCFSTGIGGALGVFPCAAAAQNASPPPAFEEALARPLSGAGSESGTPHTELRYAAMREAAQSYGARSGLVRKTYEIRRNYELTASKLDAIYNFQALLLIDTQRGEDGELRTRSILPPVITQASKVVRKESPTLLRIVDKTYRMETEPEFVTAAPTWRKYLFPDVGARAVTPPHSSLLPRNDGERARWNAWFKEGWDAGVAQAVEYDTVNFNRLERDHEGMILYHELVIKKMLSLPYVATSNKGVSGDGKNLNINESSLRITVMPEFQGDPTKWVPVQH